MTKTPHKPQTFPLWKTVLLTTVGILLPFIGYFGLVYFTQEIPGFNISEAEYFKAEKAIERTQPHFEAWTKEIHMTVNNFEGPYVHESRGGDTLAYSVSYKTQDMAYVYRRHDPSGRIYKMSPNDWFPELQNDYSNYFRQSLLYKGNEAKIERLRQDYNSQTEVLIKVD
ncbi:MAG: hypothetical protein KC474_11760 [Cyanobacteria bacterium HKST-UBA04]|nr:hypothetical protein [Cyanobacteria bacterium HKST-UBA04]MCA9842550.1 hypothetical protein [Cyanobacteria bacterium HKST-UBA03]